MSFLAQELSSVTILTLCNTPQCLLFYSTLLLSEMKRNLRWWASLSGLFRMSVAIPEIVIRDLSKYEQSEFEGSPRWSIIRNNAGLQLQMFWVSWFSIYKKNAFALADETWWRWNQGREWERNYNNFGINTKKEQKKKKSNKNRSPIRRRKVFGVLYFASNFQFAGVKDLSEHLELVWMTAKAQGNFNRLAIVVQLHLNFISAN